MLSSFLEVSKSFERTRCLVEVNFELARGDYVCLTGRSGSGKSTFLNLLAGLILPDSGLIHTGGTELSQLDEAARCAWRAATVGYIFQDFRLFSLLTVQQNLALALVIQNRPKHERPQLIQEALERCDLDSLAGRWPATLSGGEQQRVAIARATVGRPLLLLADEPTGNLDLENRERILNLLDTCHQAGTTVVTVTHDPAVAERASRRFKLENGKLGDALAVV